MAEVYKFRLQKLLDIRKDNEENSKLKFKEAQSEKNAVELELKNLNEKYKTHRNINSGESVIEQKIKQNYLNAMKTAINETKVVLENKDVILDQKRENLKRCQIEKKTVEILKDKHTIDFLKQQNLIEQNTNDEFALYAYIRKNAMGREVKKNESKC